MTLRELVAELRDLVAERDRLRKLSDELALHNERLLKDNKELKARHDSVIVEAEAKTRKLAEAMRLALSGLDTVPDTAPSKRELPGVTSPSPGVTVVSDEPRRVPKIGVHYMQRADPPRADIPWISRVEIVEIVAIVGAGVIGIGAIGLGLSYLGLVVLLSGALAGASAYYAAAYLQDRLIRRHRLPKPSQPEQRPEQKPDPPFPSNDFEDKVARLFGEP